MILLNLYLESTEGTFSPKRALLSKLEMMTPISPSLGSVLLLVALVAVLLLPLPGGSA